MFELVYFERVTDLVSDLGDQNALICRFGVIVFGKEVSLKKLLKTILKTGMQLGTSTPSN